MIYYVAIRYTIPVTFCYIYCSIFVALCYNAIMTLREIRLKSNKKIAVICEEARQIDPNFPTTHAGYLGIEELGTRDYWKIQALAHVFDMDPEAVANAVRPGRVVAKC